VQRDLYSAFLAAYLDPVDPIPSCAEVTSFPGKVRKRACGQHTSEYTNARMRGTSCPEALAVPEPERVCLEVEANPHKSLLSSSDEASWKRGRNARTPLFEPGELSDGHIR
jgi:hypothetical protein